MCRVFTARYGLGPYMTQIFFFSQKIGHKYVGLAGEKFIFIFNGQI
jgi:hypothetical protein